MGYDFSALANALNVRIAKIKKVIFNDPATIIFWVDGTKTVVKCGKEETFDPEKGFAMAVCKKSFGNQGNYYNEVKKWLPKKVIIESETKNETDDKEVVKIWITSMRNKHHGRRIVHASGCPCITNIDWNDRLYYQSLKEALANGCQCCSRCILPKEALATEDVPTCRDDAK